MVDIFNKTRMGQDPEEKWFELEGELVIDMYEVEENLVIQSAIAGVKIGDLDIHIEEDKVSIKGQRKQLLEKEEKEYFYQECYWGPFYREIMLPKKIDPSKIKAIFKEGILTLRMPIKQEEKKNVKLQTE